MKYKVCLEPYYGYFWYPQSDGKRIKIVHGISKYDALKQFRKRYPKCYDFKGLNCRFRITGILEIKK